MILIVGVCVLQGDPHSNAAGHNFLLSDAPRPTWCDTCGDLLFGLNGEHLRCQCEYTVARISVLLKKLKKPGLTNFGQI